MATEAAGPFDTLEDANELMAATLNYVFLKDGEQDLRDWLAFLISPNQDFLDKAAVTLDDIDRELLFGMRTDQQSLERIAEELAEMDLQHVAAIVLEFVADALPERVLRCPYTPEDRCNYESWQRGYENRQRMQRSK